MLLLDIFAFIPILWLLISLGFLKLPSHMATLTGLMMAAAIAFFAFRMPVAHLGGAVAEGAVFALFPIIWVIVSALFVYNVTRKSKSMDIIKDMLTSLSPDRRVQGLVLAFAFGGFLESVAGFGTAVAIPAAMMIAIGFDPFQAAVLCLIANTVPVAFGVLGVPVETLSQVSGLSIDTLGLFTSLQLFPFAVILPFILIFVITGSLSGMNGIFGLTLLSGLAFAGTQTLTVLLIGTELAAVTGSLSALAVLIIAARIRSRDKSLQIWRFELDEPFAESAESSEEKGEHRTPQMIKAWMPYILILMLIALTRLVPAAQFLQETPFVIEQQFYFGEGGKPLVIPLLTSGGSILFLSAIFGGMIQGLSGNDLLSVLGATLQQTRKTIVTVLSIVALAKVMTYSGMIGAIAVLIASSSGGMYPLIAPFIGMLGTFITGSDTSSNVLFGNLQKQTALELQLDPEWITAANASGATAGKMISPQSISIAASVTGLTDMESKMLRFTLKYCLGYVFLMGVVVMAFQRIVL